MKREAPKSARPVANPALVWINKKHYKTEAEIEEQKVERLRKIGKRQRQKLVNNIPQEKEIRLAKSGAKKLRERVENISGIGGGDNVEKSEKVDCKA